MELTIDPLVEKLELAAIKGINYTTIEGYVGSSSDQDYYRIYTTLNLQSYLEVRKDDVIEVKGKKGEESKNAPAQHIFFINSEAKLRRHKLSTVKAVNVFDEDDCGCHSVPASLGKERGAGSGTSTLVSCLARANEAYFKCWNRLGMEGGHTDSEIDDHCTKVFDAVYSHCKRVSGAGGGSTGTIG
jgi:hypothetical protein